MSSFLIARSRQSTLRGPLAGLGRFRIRHSAFCLLPSAFFIFCLLCSPALADTNDWFIGGSYDGYDLKTLPGSIAMLGVNNADGATNITAASAWLNGMLIATSNGEAATVQVYWGPEDGSTNKGSWAHTNEFGTGSEGQSFTTNVNVISNTPYYYRFYATNGNGEGWAGASASFLTPCAPALDNGIGAIPVGFTTAMLNGNFTVGISANLTVFWGQNTNEWSGTNSLGTYSVGPFWTTVSGLTTGTVYYYRCYGSNTSGESWSDTVAFTTKVGTVTFIGGNYDGYDFRDKSTAIKGYKGAMISSD